MIDEGKLECKALKDEFKRRGLLEVADSGCSFLGVLLDGVQRAAHCDSVENDGGRRQFCDNLSSCGKRGAVMKIGLAVCLLLATTAVATAQYLGNLSSNPYDPDSTSNPYGAGNPYNPNSVTNPYGTYGNPYSPNSATNPYATNAPRLYDGDGSYRGRLSTNPYDPDSISNPYGRYGSPYSPDSINNPYGAGNPYSPSSPRNPYGTGLGIYGNDDDSQ
jgi:hypothetical protein